jgi:hypothetical protein
VVIDLGEENEMKGEDPVTIETLTMIAILLVNMFDGSKAKIFRLILVFLTTRPRVIAMKSIENTVT